jgi:REP-associated tyrosine transposase
MRRSHRVNINEPSHAHELTFSCHQGFAFLSRDRTCEWMIEAMEKARQQLEFDIWAWVLMPEQVHLIVHPRRPVYDIAVIRRVIKEPVARKAVAWMKEHSPDWLSRIERRRGTRKEHVFWQSGGGYDRNIVEPTTLLAMIEYLHNNPVRRGLVERAVDWRWSSAAWYVLMQPTLLQPDPIPPEWITSK